MSTIAWNAPIAALVLALNAVAQPTPTPTPTPAPPPAAPEPATPKKPVLDWLRDTIHTRIAESALWFDSFFGSPRAEDVYAGTYGRVTGSLLWREQEGGIRPRARMRARFPMTALQGRLHLFAGRDDVEDLVSDRLEGDDSPRPTNLRQDEDEAWLAGFGYRPPGQLSRKLDFRAGVDLSFPVEGFVQGRFRHELPLGNAALLRLGQTVFWRTRQHFGATTRVDLERRLGADLLARWATAGTLAEGNDGLEWFSTVSLYHRLDTRTALAYEAWVDAENEEVDFDEYGVRAIYRRRILRQWFFVEVTAGHSWLYLEDVGSRKGGWLLGLALELQFGDRR